MGYTTEFKGSFKLDKPLKKKHRKYLTAFANTRRMKRDLIIADSLKDKRRKKVNLPIGQDGEYFVGGNGFMGDEIDQSVLESNYPPSTQPGLWCQWIPNEEGTEIVWNGVEKFYYYIEWLQYIIDNFFKRWEYKLNGEVMWQGEEMGDIGKIVVNDNSIIVTKPTFE